MLFGRKLTS
jgi:hypothetical protein